MNIPNRLLMAGLSAAVLTCWVGASASAQQLPNPMDFGKTYEELAFEAADTNADNLISVGEFARDAAAAFSGLDRNHDGKLTPSELEYNDPKLFAKVDANGDGVLTFDEVMAYKMKAFDAADKNGDGFLSFDEMVDEVNAELGRN